MHSQHTRAGAERSRVAQAVVIENGGAPLEFPSARVFVRRRHTAATPHLACPSDPAPRRNQRCTTRGCIAIADRCLPVGLHAASGRLKRNRAVHRALQNVAVPRDRNAIHH
ncbi:hypothetical protein C7S15_1918 [Burkholderia cepacia]|nr:hypothetical protein [Burkholderia cepacia]